MVSFKGKFDQRSLSLFLLSLCFLVFVYGFLFLSVSLFSLLCVGGWVKEEAILQR